MTSGGIIVFDDWNWLNGVDKAINDFFIDKPENIKSRVMHQCFIIKL